MAHYYRRSGTISFFQRRRWSGFQVDSAELRNRRVINRAFARALQDFPLAPLNGGLLLVGLMLLPLGKRQRRRVALIAAGAGLVLITALAGCSGGSSSHSSSGTSTSVFGSAP